MVWFQKLGKVVILSEASTNRANEAEAKTHIHMTLLVGRARQRDARNHRLEPTQRTPWEVELDIQATLIRESCRVARGEHEPTQGNFEQTRHGRTR